LDFFKILFLYRNPQWEFSKPTNTSEKIHPGQLKRKKREKLNQINENSMNDSNDGDNNQQRTRSIDQV
jgi:hypothetical protein